MSQCLNDQQRAQIPNTQAINPNDCMYTNGPIIQTLDTASASKLQASQAHTSWSPSSWHIPVCNHPKEPDPSQHPPCFACGTRMSRGVPLTRTLSPTFRVRHGNVYTYIQRAETCGIAHRRMGPCRSCLPRNICKTAASSRRLWACACVCVCICMVCVFLYFHACPPLCVYVHVYAYAYAYVYMYMHMHVNLQHFNVCTVLKINPHDFPFLITKKYLSQVLLTTRGIRQKYVCEQSESIWHSPDCVREEYFSILAAKAFDHADERLQARRFVSVHLRVCINPVTRAFTFTRMQNKPIPEAWSLKPEARTCVLIYTHKHTSNQPTDTLWTRG